MREEMGIILGIQNYKCALVEAGHFYANKPFGLEQEIGVRTGLAVISALREMGIKVIPCLLMDDYNTPDLLSTENITKIGEQGFSPSIIFREGEYKKEGEELLENLEAANKVKIRKKTGEKYLKQGFIKLVKEDGRLTCALLDAVLYKDKYQMCEGVCVTVLPDTEDYRVQQDYTKQIIKEAGLTIPILNVYFDQTGKISLDFDF